MADKINKPEFQPVLPGSDFEAFLSGLKRRRPEWFQGNGMLFKPPRHDERELDLEEPPE